MRILAHLLSRLRVVRLRSPRFSHARLVSLSSLPTSLFLPYLALHLVVHMADQLRHLTHPLELERRQLSDLEVLHNPSEPLSNLLPIKMYLSPRVDSTKRSDGLSEGRRCRKRESGKKCKPRGSPKAEEDGSYRMHLSERILSQGVMELRNRVWRMGCQD